MDGCSLAESVVGVNAYRSGFVLLRQCNFSSLSSGVQSNSDNQEILAEECYWGHPSGPIHSSNPSGQGVAVSDNVDFTPWSEFPVANTVLEPVVVSPDLYHLGPNAPPCGLDVAASNLPIVSQGFQISSDQLESLSSNGAVLRFDTYSIEEGTEVVVNLNGHTLTSPIANPNCDPALYFETVTPFVQSGTNYINIGAVGDDLVVGNFQLIEGSYEGGITSVASTIREAVTIQIEKDGAPYDGVNVVIYDSSSELTRGQPNDGSFTYSLPHAGTFQYQIVEPVQESGSVLDSGVFVINLDNDIPGIQTASATPSVVNNSGVETVEFRITPDQDDDGIASATIDLAQISGVNSTPMEADGAEFVASLQITSGVTPRTYQLPVQIVDGMGASYDFEISLQVVPVGDIITFQHSVAGFNLTASEIEETTPGTYVLSGNVQMTHNSGLPLYLDADGSITAVLDPPEIRADTDVTLRADLGDLGIYDLFRGEFTIGEGGDITIAEGAENLLDEVVGYAIDPEVLTLDLMLESNPGININAHMICDKVDGIEGNGEPRADLSAELRIDGSISGSLTNDIPWDLQAGSLSFSQASWTNEYVEIDGATFQFLDGTFDFDSKTSLSVPTLRITPDGISADGLVLDDFDFSYGGFQFVLEEAVFTNEDFFAEHARMAFPLGNNSDLFVAVEGISVAQGRVTLTGGEFQLPPLKIGDYDLAGVSAGFAYEGDNWYLAAAGKLAIPAFATVDIAFRLDSQCEYYLNEFCMNMELSGTGLPIGNTGFLLTDIGGCLVDDGCLGVWVISFTAGVSSADRIVPPGISLIHSDSEITVIPDPFYFQAIGTIDLVGNRLGSAGFELYPDHFHGFGSLQMPPVVPMLYVDSDLYIHWQPSFDFNGAADGRLEIPADRIPIWQDPIQLAEFHAEVGRAGIRGAFYVPNPEDPWAEVTADFNWEGDLEVEYAFTNPFLYVNTATGQRIGARQYDRMIANGTPLAQKSGDRNLFNIGQVELGNLVLPASADNWLTPTRSASDKAQLTFRDVIQTVSVPENASPMVIMLEELPTGSNAEMDVVLLMPDGTTVDADYCDANTGFVYHRSEDWHLFRVESPAAGNWQIDVNGVDTGESYELQIKWVNEKPQVVLLSPASSLQGNTDSAYEIAWDASDADNDSLGFDLYAIAELGQDVKAGDDPGPWLIASDLADTTRSFSWTPSAFKTGSYQVVVKAHDAYHLAVADTSDAVVTLDNASLPGRVSGLEARVGPDAFRLSWDPLTMPDIHGYRIHWQGPDDTAPYKFDVGQVSQFLLTSLYDGVDYTLWVSAYDNEGRSGPLSTSIIAAPHPLGDIEPPAIPTGLTMTDYDVDANVATLTWDEVSDAVNYRVYYDTDVVFPYGGSGAAEGDSCNAPLYFFPLQSHCLT
jgi:hypothetical protein